MIATTSTAALAVSALAVAASVTFVATMLRYRFEPAQRPLFALAVALLVGAVAHLAIVDLAPVRAMLGIEWGPTTTVGGFWLLFAFDLPAVVGGCWFLFALQYTDRDRQTSTVARSAVVALFALLVGLNLALDPAGDPLGLSEQTVNALIGVVVVLSEALGLVGVFLVIATTGRHKAFPAGQIALLTLSVGAVLVLPFVATTLRLPVATPVAITASSALFTATVHRYRVFGTLPVASVAGRDRVIEEMSEGVVMVDADGRVRDLNPAAEALFDVSRGDVVGEPIDDALPSLPDPGPLADATDVRPAGDRTVSATADPVTDAHGRTLGHLLVCRDVTAERRREHRLAVLTQSVAGATQEQLERVRAEAAAVAAGDRQPTAAGAAIGGTATAVADLVARVRDVERALADRDPEPEAVAVGAAARDAATGEASVSGPEASIPAAADADLLVATLETLITGASAAADEPTLRVRADGDGAAVAVSPFRPGDEGSIAALSLRIARLAAEDAAWRVAVGDGSVEVRLPPADGAAGGESP